MKLSKKKLTTLILNEIKKQTGKSSVNENIEQLQMRKEISENYDKLNNEALEVKPTKRIGRGTFNVVSLSGGESGEYTKVAQRFIDMNNHLSKTETQLKDVNKILDKKIIEFKNELKKSSGLDIDSIEDKVKTLKSQVKIKQKELFDYSINNIFGKLRDEIDSTIGIIVETKSLTSQFNAPAKKIDYIKILNELVKINAVSQDVIDNITQQFTTFDDTKRKLKEIVPNINENNLREGLFNKVKMLFVNIWIKMKNSFTSLLASTHLKNKQLNKSLKHINRQIN